MTLGNQDGDMHHSPRSAKMSVANRNALFSMSCHKLTRVRTGCTVQVPQELTGAQLDVRLEVYRVRVACKASQEIFFEGELERGIVPRESVWETGQGRGEDGFIMHLHKMNLELLRQ